MTNANQQELDYDETADSARKILFSGNVDKDEVEARMKMLRFWPEEPSKNQRQKAQREI